MRLVVVMIAACTTMPETPARAAAADGNAGARTARSLDEVRSTVIRLHDEIHGVDCTYESTASGTAPDLPGTSSSHRVVQKGTLRFAENVHDDPHHGPESDVNHTRQYFTGKTFDVFYVNSRFYETSTRSATGISPWKLRVDHYLTATGWWPRDDDPPPDNFQRAPYRPLRFLLAAPECKLSPDVEVVDGAECLVVGRPGKERVWIDPSLNYAVRRWELLHPETGGVLIRAHCSEFRPYELSRYAKVWFPMREEVVRFDFQKAGRGERSENEPPKDLTVNYRVKRIELNHVNDDVFQFTPPPGTLIQDRDTGDFMLVPGGRDLLDRTVAIGRRFIAAPAGTHEHEQKWHFAAIAVGGLVALAALGRNCRRARGVSAAAP